MHFGSSPFKQESKLYTPVRAASRTLPIAYLEEQARKLCWSRAKAAQRFPQLHEPQIYRYPWKTLLSHATIRKTKEVSRSWLRQRAGQGFPCMRSMPKGMETTKSTWSQRQQGQAPEGEAMNREKLQADNGIWVPGSPNSCSNRSFTQTECNLPRSTERIMLVQDFSFSLPDPGPHKFH